MKKLVYTLSLAVLSLSTVSSSLFAQTMVRCRCVYSGIVDQAEIIEGETPLEACQSIGQGFVPFN